MRYFDKTFFKFLLGFSLIIIGGLIFVSRVEAAIDINTASFEELQTLDGIGAVKAQAIIDYRNGPNGPFEQLEELMEVSGIGETTFENIRNDVFVGESNEENDEEDDESNSSSGGGGSAKSRESDEPKELKITAHGNKVGVVGIAMKFEATSNKDSIKSGNYSWSLGDGSVATGEEVEHVYQYPGEYVAVLRVRTKSEDAVARLNIKIVPDTLKVSKVDSARIEVWNDGDFEIDLFGRVLFAGGSSFTFPEDTIIKPNQKISFPASVTGLAPIADTQVILNTVSSKSESAEDKFEISLVDQEKIKELREQIASLQLKQMELRRAEESRVEENFASSVFIDEFATVPDEEGGSKEGWVGTLKRFFGFE